MFKLYKIRGLNKLLSLINVQSGNTRQQAVSMTVGFYMALFPVIGMTTFLGFVVSLIFKLNHLIVQGLNIALSPVQFLLFYPFLNFGSWFFFGKKIDIQVIFMQSKLLTINLDSLYKLIEALSVGVVIWGLVFIATGPFFYLTVTFYLKKKNRFEI
jgi:uncharacterized protein (DUF2062 family)